MKQVNQQSLNKAMACQTQNEQYSQQERNEMQLNQVSDRLWEVMEEMYSSKWVKRNGAIANTLWMEALQTLTNQQIKLGIERCKEKIFGGNAWPPDLAEFLALIHGQTEVDYHSAFLRCLAKNPEGRIEQWVYENAGYNIRVSSHDAAERMHKKFMKEAAEKDRRGDLTLNEEMLKALPPNSVKNDNDLARERYEEAHGKELHPRIKKLLEGKR